VAVAPAAPARLLLEKAPLLAMSVASSALTLAAQSLVEVEKVGLGARVANAIVSYARYVVSTLWPVDLAALYPLRSPLPAWEVAAAALAVGAATALALRGARRLPWAAVGWLWFLGALVPVIGLVQVGSQAMADRYTYLPSIGLLVAAVWGAHRLLAARPRLLAAAALAVVAALSVLTWRQAGRWKDHETIFRHTLAVTGENAVAHGMLAMGLRRSGRPAEAQEHAALAARLDPDDARHFAELSRVERDLKRPGEAYEAARRAVVLEPGAGLTWTVLGAAAGDLGRGDEAEAALRRAAELLPEEPQVWIELGLAAARAGRPAQAREAYGRALALDPGSAAAWSSLAILEQGLGRSAEAGEAFAAAARADPGNPTIWRNLGVFQAMTGRPADAAAAFEQGLRLAPSDPELLVRLGLAQLALGARADALATAARLEAIAPPLAAELRARAAAAQ
jgi:Flp pilus assembly protein TadD